MAFVMVMTANAWGMQVYIHFLNGTWPTGVSLTSGNLVVEMESSDSFENLKAKIQDKTGFDPSGMKLSYGTYDDLADDKTLFECGITQTGTTINLTYSLPHRTDTDPNSWAFKMPRGPRVLRTTWKKDAQLAWKVGEETVTVESNPLVAYVGFPFEGATLTAANDDILELVDYSIVHQIGTYSGSTISTTGVVAINGPGIDTVMAILAGNDTLMSDTAMYIIDSRDPYTLTLSSNDETMGTVGLATPLPEGVMAGSTAGQYYVIPSTEVTVIATPNSGYQLVKWEDNSTNASRTVTMTRDTTLTATFGPSTPGLTPEGEETTQGTRFVDEHGKIVGQPRVNKHGKIIVGGGSSVPVVDLSTVSGSSYTVTEDVILTGTPAADEFTINHNDNNYEITLDNVNPAGTKAVSISDWNYNVHIKLRGTSRLNMIFSAESVTIDSTEAGGTVILINSEETPIISHSTVTVNGGTVKVKCTGSNFAKAIFAQNGLIINSGSLYLVAGTYGNGYDDDVAVSGPSSNSPYKTVTEADDVFFYGWNGSSWVHYNEYDDPAHKYASTDNSADPSTWTW